MTLPLGSPRSRQRSAVDTRGSRMPLLRMPPSPGAAPVGRPRLRVAGEAISHPDRHDRIIAALRTARVGGCFWGERPDVAAFTTLARVRSIDMAEALLARGLVDRDSTLFWLDRPGRRANSGALRAVSGALDPWPLLDSATRIIAEPDDEVALLAAALDKPVLDPGSGVALAHAIGRTHLSAAIDAFRYADPFFGTPIDAQGWIAELAAWRARIDSDRDITAIAGIARWKRDAIRRQLWAGRPVPFGGRRGLRETRGLAVWPSRVSPTLLRAAARAGTPVVRIEDGFIRSIGLGARLHPPCSIVVDRSGIHYDPSAPSDLETLLATTSFDPALVARAERLIAAVVTAGITKYAVGAASAAVPAARGVRRILVPGQVEDDLSVRYGSAGVAGNLDLLRRVRAAEPNAWIGYRPHPDVTSGLRKGHVRARDALRYADAVMARGPIASLLERIDCVHVLTSLAGFEALLRGREVVTHGQPFYAGWGLTADLAPPLRRRGRRLTLEQLVAGALILYARYLDPVTGLPCPPEILVRRHAEAGPVRDSLANRARALQGALVVTARGWREARA